MAHSPVCSLALPELEAHAAAMTLVPKQTSEAAAQALLDECSRLQRSGDGPACQASALQLLTLDPSCARAWAYVGWAQFQQRQPSDAAAALQRALCSHEAQDWSARERFNMHTLLQVCCMSNTMQGAAGSLSCYQADTQTAAAEAACNPTKESCSTAKPSPTTTSAADTTTTATAAALPNPKLSPGDMLRAGWHAQHLMALLNEGRLAPAGKGPSDCDILGGPAPAQPASVGRRPSPSAQPEDDFGSAILHEWTTSGAHEIYFGNGGERSVAPDTVHPFPSTQARGGVVYHKGTPLLLRCKPPGPDTWSDGSSCYEQGRGPCYRCRRYFPAPSYAFPLWRMPANLTATIQQPHPDLDVFYATQALSPASHTNLVCCLDQLGRVRRDFPAPKYHNIIDPNIGAVDGVWVPSDVWVSEAATPAACAQETASQPRSLLGADPGGLDERPQARLAGPIPDLDPYQHPQVYRAVNDVLTAAVPLLAQLTRPALLLPGPLQVVVKAQRIVLAEGEEYAGIWHEDGLREHVQAGILYYYRASPSLRGGALEFCSKDAKAFGWGDCGSTKMLPEATSRLSHALPRCQVPVSEGTLVVFSNYAAVHRVLTMQADKDAPGSRDFVALFVIDQRRPLASRELGPLEERRAAREGLLQEQLQPRGRFGADSAEVYSTGNGSFADVGWRSEGRDWYEDDITMAAAAKLERLNFTPPLDRGMSWCLEPQHSTSEATTWNPGSAWAEHIVGSGPRDARSFFVHQLHGEVCIQPPPDDEGVSLVQRFNDMQQWHAEWMRPGSQMWTHDPDLQELLELLQAGAEQ